jgi:hypothetical protein
MKRTLHIFQRIKPPAVIFISVFVFIITLAQGAAAQEVVQTGNTLYNTNTLAGSNIAIGEIVWVIITLAFSFVLNLYLRRKEKRPEKISISQPEPEVQQLETIPVKHKTETIKLTRIKRTNKLAHKFAYQRERVMQPFTAVQYLSVSHKKNGVAS